MKKSEFAKWLGRQSGCCPNDDKCISPEMYRGDTYCIKHWTEFLASLEDDEPHVCEWKDGGEGYKSDCGKEIGSITAAYLTGADYCPFCGRKRGEG